MKKKVINKGYTLEVVSWENDGDNYNTLSTTVQSKNEALALQGLVKLSDSTTTHTDRGLGNLNSWTPVHKQLVVDYIQAHPEVIPSDWDIVPDTEYNCMSIYSELAYELLGGCEWYVSRVHESSTITYSPEDIYVELIAY